MWVDLDLVSLDTFTMFDPVILELIGFVSGSIPQASTAQILPVYEWMMNMSADYLISCSHPVWIKCDITIRELCSQSWKLCICCVVVMDDGINLVILCIVFECEIEPARSLFIFVGRLSEGSVQRVTSSRVMSYELRILRPVNHIWHHEDGFSFDVVDLWGSDEENPSPLWGTPFVKGGFTAA